MSFSSVTSLPPTSPQPFPAATALASLGQVRVVLVEPAGPLNVGAIARVMKNMGLSQLVLVNPRCSTRDDEAVRMAVHAADVLAGATVVSSLSEALQDCRDIVGTVGRTQPMEFEIGEPRATFPRILLPEHLPAAVVFGPEDRGLNNQELGMCRQQVFIPTSDVYPSMNLAQAVGICAYEVRQAALSTQSGRSYTSPISVTDVEPHISPSLKAPSQALEGFYRQLEQVLLQIGYLYPHTAPRKLLKFRRLFDRAQLTLNDVALLRGVLRQLAWADRHLSPLPSSQTVSEPTSISGSVPNDASSNEPTSGI
ncbi:MAG: RNA methyltransferase [Cyanobacteria bacterium J06597_1]